MSRRPDSHNYDVAVDRSVRDAGTARVAPTWRRRTPRRRRFVAACTERASWRAARSLVKLVIDQYYEAVACCVVAVDGVGGRPFAVVLVDLAAPVAAAVVAGAGVEERRRACCPRALAGA